MKLKPTKQTDLSQKNEVKRDWYLVDAKNKILGRLASTITNYLLGKHKKNFVPHLDMGDNVVVVNVEQINLTGKKLDQKIYRYYSGYPGGLKKITLKKMLAEKPEEVVRHAVLGMLPKNKLRKQRIKRLFVYKTEDHPFKNRSFITVE